ncbi:MAG: hypothetical protein K2H43_04115 [Clostridia bacterium]|nr:hypothetical protein [Clostridia bacterium]
MKKLFKKLAFVAAAVCLALTGVFCAACGNSGGNSAETTYSLTVLLPDGSPAEDIVVAYCEADNAQVCNFTRTNAQGIASGTYKTTNYHVAVSGFDINQYDLPEDWKTTKSYTDNWGGNSYTVKLVEKSEA